MIELPEFPRSLMREQTSTWQLKASTVSPGQSASGSFARASYGGGGLWKADYSSINLRTADHVRAWRAMEVLCDGGVSPVIVPMCDKRQMPANVIEGRLVYSYGNLPHSDGTVHDDGAGYYQASVVAITARPAPLRSVTLPISFISNSELRGGEMFSINHPTQGWRVYQIGLVESGGGVSDVTIRPPLREAVPAATVVEFDQPRCVMMLSDPNAMQLAMTRRRFANPDVSFIEYLFPS